MTIGINLGLGSCAASSSMGAVPEFDPTTIANCRLWLRADVGITESGGAISAWADQSGVGNHVAQATAAKPTYLATGGPNGGPCADFDGSDDRFDGSLLSAICGASAKSWFVLFNCDAIDTDDASGYLDDALISDGGGGFAIYLRSTGPKVHSYNYDGTEDYTAGITFATGVWRIACLRHDGVDQKLILNGDSQISGASGATDAGVMATAIKIGNNYSGGKRFDGKIAEIVAFNRAVTDGERDITIAGILARWGL